MRELSFVLLTLVTPASALAQADSARVNRFNDPFFQLSAEIPRCPKPLGPRITAAEMRIQSHHRAEQGTPCWLAGKCDKSNAFAYDSSIASALQAKVAGSELLKQSTLWVTVQRRIVFIDGCVRDPAIAGQLEALVKTVPNVQQAFASVSSNPSARPPYRTIESP
jgi:hypothetical protein